MKKRKRFTREFKLEAVRLLEQGQTPAADLARQLGIRRNQLNKWKDVVDQKGEDAFPGRGQAINLPVFRLFLNVRPGILDVQANTVIELSIDLFIHIGQEADKRDIRLFDHNGRIVCGNSQHDFRMRRQIGLLLRREGYHAVLGRTGVGPR